MVAPIDLPSPLHLVLLCPTFGLSTAAVYQKVVVPATPSSGKAILDGFFGNS